jgi:hypothetical protein
MTKNTQENEYADFERPYMMTDKTNVPKDTVEFVITHIKRNVLWRDNSMALLENHLTDLVTQALTTAYKKGVEEERKSLHNRLTGWVVAISTGEEDIDSLTLCKELQDTIISPDDKL